MKNRPVMLPVARKMGRMQMGLERRDARLPFYSQSPCTILDPWGLNSRAFSEVSEVGLGGVVQRDWLS